MRIRGTPGPGFAPGPGQKVQPTRVRVGRKICLNLCSWLSAAHAHEGRAVADREVVLVLTLEPPRWRPRGCPRCRGAVYREATGTRRRREVVWTCLACGRTFGQEELAERERLRAEAVT